MLAVANTIKAAHENQGTHMVENFNPNIISDNSFHEDFEDQLLEFSDGTSLLESINFDDLFMGDVLPDLEMDPEILAEFSVSAGSTQEESYTINESAQNCKKVDDGFWRKEKIEEEAVNNESDNKVSDSRRVINHNQEEVIESNKREIEGNNQSVKSSVNVAATKESDKGRKSSSTTQSKINSNNQGKRKVKVDWTPELHRRFVQAVEQLGVDKAVPSRILELMGIDCLTRHNIASHLQKYRSHRKHLLAREAEAANLNQRRQTYGCAAAVGDGGRKWHAPHTIGIPQRATPTLHPHLIRPLHVWGHRSMDQSLLHVWPKHLALQPQLPGLTVPPPDPSYWHHHHQRVLSTTPGTPYFPRPLAPTQFQAPPVPGVPPTGIYKINGGIRPRQSDFHSLFDFHPSKESVDAAIGDVLAKPWLPFPLGLRPPSVDGVMVELQRQGVARIPPATFTA